MIGSVYVQQSKKAMSSPLPAFLIAYSDSDFTNPHEVVLPDAPKDCTGDFTHMGAKYWGVESRRHKATTVLAKEQALAYDHNAHNWFLIGLKERAEINTITISTKWYTGNQVRAVSVYLKDEVTGQNKQVLDRAPLAPDKEHSFTIPPTTATECLVECYYEGGIARVNLFGTPMSPKTPQRANLLEGAEISHVSNVHYGDPARAVAGNRKEMHMFGWESARTGFGEQALFHLKKPARIDEIVVDTYLHRLNAPLTCHVFALNGFDEKHMKSAPRWKLVFENGKEAIPDNFQAYMLEQKYLPEKNFKIKLHIEKDSPWKPLLPFAPLTPDTFHRFRQLENVGAVTHILYMHYPNGGVHGLKMYELEI
jgi:allantoicase